ncbi:MAG: helix-turn-helix domain-containing protein, partial [Deltaproteobacteria bacterium]|nr:helix-turn-helix domain-containing protein [Deltaproteobacteria bacterium]
TPIEVAEQLNIQVRTLDHWAHHNQGPAYVKVGRLRRYRQSDVDHYLTSRTVDAGK